MRYSNPRSPKATVISVRVLAGLSLLLMACQDLGPVEPEGPPAGTARVAGEVRDFAGQPVANAAIRVPHGDRQYYQVMTGADGRYSMNLPVAPFTNVSPVVLFVVKEGFRPFAGWYDSIEEGASYNFGTNGQNLLQVLQLGEFYPPNATMLVHAGDDNYGGSENSQLQVASQGTLLAYTLTAWTTQLATAKSATISFIGRGIQSSICPGTSVGLVSARGTGEGLPGNSDVQGGFSSYALNVNIPPTDVGANISVYIASGWCGNNYDDFEIGRVFVQFHF